VGRIARGGWAAVGAGGGRLVGRQGSDAGYRAAARGKGTVDEDKKKLAKQLFALSSIGLSMVLAIFIGLAAGVFLDNRLNTHHPWFTIILLGLGIIAGFRNIFWFVKHYGVTGEKRDKKKDGEDA
jgi:ATP synthase protein I